MTEMSPVRLRRWTRQEYDRMIEAGVLTPEDRVELIEGEILTMTPRGSAHVTAVSPATRSRRRALPGAAIAVSDLLA
jgi:Uma2 family endonuclease